MYTTKSSIEFIRLIARIVLNIILIFVGIISIYIYIGVENLEITSIIYIYMVGIIALLMNIGISKKIQLLGPASLVFLYTVVSHFGWIIGAIFDFQGTLIHINKVSWLYEENLGKVFAISYIACLVWYICMTTRLKVFKTTRTKRTLNEYDIVKMMKKIGIIVIYTYSIYLLLQFMIGGMPKSGYIAYKVWASGRPELFYLQRVFWVAIIPVFINFDKTTMKKVGVPLTIIGTILFITGNRNDIGYPLVIAVGIYILENKKFPKTLILIGAILLFVVSPIISETRKEGTLDLKNNELEFKIEETFFELGSQVRPFTIVEERFENGFVQLNGSTFVLPTFYTLLTPIIDFSHIYEEYEYSITKVLGVNGLGFSMIAEVYINFKMIGVIIIYALLGIYCSFKENYYTNKIDLIIYGQVMVLFMLLARNEMLYNFIQIKLIFIYYLMCWGIVGCIKLLKRKGNKIYGRKN